MTARRAPKSTKIADEFLVVPTPGHTEGHLCLLFEDKFPFTGDHLSWDREQQRLTASSDYCWFSWNLQKTSLERLASHRFEWILPGHGQRMHLPPDEMNEQVQALLSRL